MVHPKGTQAGEADPKVKELIANGRRVLLLEPYKAPPVSDKIKFFLTFQKSEADVWTKVAAAMAPKPPKLLDPNTPLPASDEEWLKSLPAPGIRWALN